MLAAVAMSCASSSADQPAPRQIWKSGSPASGWNAPVLGDVGTTGCGTLEIDSAVHSADDTASVHVKLNNGVAACGTFFTLLSPGDMTKFKQGKFLFNLRSANDWALGVGDARSQRGTATLSQIGHLPSADAFSPVVVPVRNVTSGSGVDYSSFVRVAIYATDINGGKEFWIDNLRWSAD